MVKNTRGNNTNLKLIGGVLLAVSLGLVLAGCGGGGDNANTAPATNTAATNTSKTNANTNASEGSFSEAAMTWGRVEEARAELDKVVEENKLDEVHEAAFKVRDAVKELPGQSTSLASDRREKLDSQVRQVERLAGMLDEAGDSNNAKSVHEHHKAMDEALDAIMGLYPAGVMPGRARAGEGMHGMDKDKLGMGKDKKMGGKNMPRNKNDNTEMKDMDDH